MCFHKLTKPILTEYKRMNTAIDPKEYMNETEIFDRYVIYEKVLQMMLYKVKEKKYQKVQVLEENTYTELLHRINK